MDNDLNPNLRSVFAAYSPSILEEPFLTEARKALAKEVHRARVRSALSYALLPLLGGWIAIESFETLAAFGSSLDNVVAQSTAALSPMTSQLLIYTATAAVAILGRRWIRAFLMPW